MSRRKLSAVHEIGCIVCQATNNCSSIIITTCLFRILDLSLFIGYMYGHKNVSEEEVDCSMLCCVWGEKGPRSVLKPPSVLVLVNKLDLDHKRGFDKQSCRRVWNDNS